MQYSKETFNSIIKNKKHQFLIVASLVLIVSYYFSFLFQKSFSLLPNQNKTQIHPFGDQIDNGKSTVKNFYSTDSLTSIEYILQKGFLNPYTGISFTPHNSFFNFEKYNRVAIDIAECSGDNYFLYLIAEEAKVRNKKHRLASRYLGLHLKLKEPSSKLILDLNDLETPNWWYDIIAQPPSDFDDILLKKINSISLTTGVSPKINEDQILKIRSIIFYKDNTLALTLLVCFEALFLILLFIIEWKKIKNSKIKPIEIKYKAIETEEETKNEDLTFLDYINKNYQDPELTLTKVATITGTQERTISKIIAEKFNCNFKTYINNIRIEEAQRLLANTKLNISEIAYTVGFNSPSTFNKVFKKTTGMTPSETK